MSSFITARSDATVRANMSARIQSSTAAVPEFLGTRLPYQCLGDDPRDFETHWESDCVAQFQTDVGIMWGNTVCPCLRSLSLADPLADLSWRGPVAVLPVPSCSAMWHFFCINRIGVLMIVRVGLGASRPSSKYLSGSRTPND